MGTRGLRGYIINSERHGTYNHSDSYPDVLGKDIVSDVLSVEPENYAKMAEDLREITWVPEDIDNDELAELAKDKNRRTETDSIDFLDNGLFCEWAYFVDFEHQRMEVWKSGEFLTELSFDELVAEGEDIMDRI